MPVVWARTRCAFANLDIFWVGLNDGLATIPVAMFSERYNARQWPLIIGIVTLAGSQVMFMEAPNYPVMCIARVIQGVGSSMVWVVGLALL